MLSHSAFHSFDSVVTLAHIIYMLETFSKCLHGSHAYAIYPLIWWWLKIKLYTVNLGAELVLKFLILNVTQGILPCHLHFDLVATNFEVKVQFLMVLILMFRYKPGVIQGLRLFHVLMFLCHLSFSAKAFCLSVHSFVWLDSSSNQDISWTASAVEQSRWNLQGIFSSPYWWPG